MFIVECRAIINVWKCIPIFIKHVFIMFALWSTPNPITIKYKGPIKKTSHWRPIYLTSGLQTKSRTMANPWATLWQGLSQETLDSCIISSNKCYNIVDEPTKLLAVLSICRLIIMAFADFDVVRARCAGLRVRVGDGRACEKPWDAAKASKGAWQCGGHWQWRWRPPDGEGLGPAQSALPQVCLKGGFPAPPTRCVWGATSKPGSIKIEGLWHPRRHAHACGCGWVWHELKILGGSTCVPPWAVGGFQPIPSHRSRAQAHLSLWRWPACLRRCQPRHLPCVPRCCQPHAPLRLDAALWHEAWGHWHERVHRWRLATINTVASNCHSTPLLHLIYSSSTHIIKLARYWLPLVFMYHEFWTLQKLESYDIQSK